MKNWTVQSSRSQLLAKVQDSALKRGGRCLGAIAGLQFAQDTFDMEFRGVFGEAQQVSDFLVA